MNLDPITAFLDIGSKVIDRLWPNPTERDAAKLKLLEMQQSGEMARLAAETDLAKMQGAINQAEAENASVFVSGWRPWIGWVCGTAFAYHFVLQPLIAFIMAANGKTFPLPAFDIESLLTVLLGMLGLGGLRTFEKVKGVSK